MCALSKPAQPFRPRATDGTPYQSTDQKLKWNFLKNNRASTSIQKYTMEFIKHDSTLDSNFVSYWNFKTKIKYFWLIRLFGRLVCNIHQSFSLKFCKNIFRNDFFRNLTSITPQRTFSGFFAVLSWEISMRIPLAVPIRISWGVPSWWSAFSKFLLRFL